MLTRSIVLSTSSPEQTMAHRLLYDDASIRISHDIPEAVDLSEDVPLFARDKQEKHYVRQVDAEVYLCGPRADPRRITPLSEDGDVISELRLLLHASRARKACYFTEE